MTKRCSNLVANGAFLVFLLCMLIGCGSSKGGTSASQPQLAVIIVQSPASVVVPLGSTTTFTVTASGGGTLTYQWTRNGTPIVGAVSASYMTPAVSLGDTGTVFAVIVSNTSSSAMSANATLTVGARSPKAGDIRLLLWQQGATLGLGTSGGGSSNLISNSSAAEASALGSPLFLGSTADCNLTLCAWPFSFYTVAASPNMFHMGYSSDAYANFVGDLGSIALGNVVVTSLDLEPAESTFAIAAVTATGLPVFSQKLEVVPVTAVQATTAQDGLASRVVTAVSVDANGQINLISYGWQGDTTTIYQTQTMTVTGSNVQAAATALAQAGYVISAFGGNDSFGYVLIGTRVQGDTQPRPFTVSTNGVMGMGFVPAVNAAANVPFTPVVQLNFVGGEVLITEQ